MKQGRADRSGSAGRKVEPNPKAVSPCAVSELGSALGNVKGGRLITSEPLYEGKGYKAPMSGSSNHKSGSQGRH
jgi:hypothetical protein